MNKIKGLYIDYKDDQYLFFGEINHKLNIELNINFENLEFIGKAIEKDSLIKYEVFYDHNNSKYFIKNVPDEFKDKYLLCQAQFDNNKEGPNAYWIISYSKFNSYIYTNNKMIKMFKKI